MKIDWPAEANRSLRKLHISINIEISLDSVIANVL